MKALLFFISAVALSGAAPAEIPQPKLIVAISVDQFSTDLFNEYRARFTGGLKTLQQGAVFANGFQSHAATETCPGHATILTGAHPARSGIVANYWVDYDAPRAEKQVYCAEDEHKPESRPDKPVISTVHLKAKTLGERMKRFNPASRIIAVAGKDRAAVMMGGELTDEMWWWDNGKFSTLTDRNTPASVRKINDDLAETVQNGLPTPALPDLCRPYVGPVAVTSSKSVGNPLGPLPPKTPKGMRVRPELDQATLAIATKLADDYQLGRRATPDLLAISLSVTDYVGHNFGTEGPEMCAQIMTLDQALDGFLKHLDASGVRYVVMLTADHGGHDVTERNRARAIPDDLRVTAAVGVNALNEAMGYRTKGPFRVDDPKSDTIAGDLYLDPSVKGKKRRKLLADARRWLAGKKDMIAAVLTRDELLATRPSAWPPETWGLAERAASVDAKRSGDLIVLLKPRISPIGNPPETWGLAERAAASVDAKRSGDLIVLLKPRISPIGNPGEAYVATHGSPWDYDRRVPILFWRAGMTSFEQPNSIETVDIMPTLAALIGLPVPAGEIDGRCRDLDAGPGSSCPANLGSGP